MTPVRETASFASKSETGRRLERCVRERCSGCCSRDLLDVDAAHVAEDDHGPAGGGVPGDGGVVLLLDRAALLDEHAHRLLPVDLDTEDCPGCLGGLPRACRRSARRRPSSARR